MLDKAAWGMQWACGDGKTGMTTPYVARARPAVPLGLWSIIP